MARHRYGPSRWRTSVGVLSEYDLLPVGSRYRLMLPCIRSLHLLLSRARRGTEESFKDVILIRRLAVSCFIEFRRKRAVRKPSI